MKLSNLQSGLDRIKDFNDFMINQLNDEKLKPNEITDAFKVIKNDIDNIQLLLDNIEVVDKLPDNTEWLLITKDTKYEGINLFNAIKHEKERMKN